jgi:hypothetical protein
MATSGNFTGTTNNQYIQAKLVWTAQQSAGANTSTVTAALYYRRTNTGYTTKGTWSGSVTIGGQSGSGSAALTITSGSWAKALEVTKTISHNADGTKSITLSASGGIPGTSFTSTAISQTVTLTPIPRATTPTLPSSQLTIGQTVRIALPRASGAFTHQLWWRIGSGSWWKIGSTHGDHCDWTLPEADMCPKIPSATSATAELWCETDSGSTKIGDKVITFTALVPAHVKPTVTDFTLTPVNDNATVAEWGVCLRGYTKLGYTLAGAGAYGSTVTDWEIQVPGAGETLYTASGATKPLASTDGKVTAWVRDSRGRWSAAAVRTVTVLDYGAPTIGGSHAFRCGPDGAASDSGAYLNVACAGEVFPVDGHNTKTCRVRWRPVGGVWSGYTDLTGRNLLPYPYHHTTRTEAGITWTDNGDGTVTANGKATAFVVFSCHQRLQGEANDFICPNGTYRVGGCPAGGGAGRYRIDVGVTRNGKWQSLGVDYGDGVTVTVAGDDYGTESANLGFQLQVYNGATVNDLTFTPTLRAASEGGDTVLSAALSVTASYEVELSVRDALGSEKTVVWPIPTAEVALHLRRGGHGAAFGKYSEKENTLEVDWDVEIHGRPVADFVVARGSDGPWSWEKWAGGKAVCWGLFATGEMTMTASGSVYLSDVMTRPLPAGLFAAAPVALVQVAAGGALIGAKATGATDKDTLAYQVLRTWSGGDGTYVAACCLGRWQ